MVTATDHRNRPALLRHDAIILHDGARLQTSNRSFEWLRRYVWEVMGHPRYVWEVMGRPRYVWEVMGRPRYVWEAMGRPRYVWEAMGHPRYVWKATGHPLHSTDRTPLPRCARVFSTPPKLRLSPTHAPTGRIKAGFRPTNKAGCEAVHPPSPSGQKLVTQAALTEFTDTPASRGA